MDDLMQNTDIVLRIYWWMSLGSGIIVGIIIPLILLQAGYPYHAFASTLVCVVIAYVTIASWRSRH